MCIRDSHMTTTRLYLIRHGQTAHSAADVFSGASNVDLADEGRRQATCLAQRLAGEPIAAFYCSSLQRAIETATLVAQPHGLTPTPVADLREIDYGHWEGLPRAEVLARFGDEYTTWGRDPLTCAPRDGETGLAEMCIRDRPSSDRPNKTASAVRFILLTLPVPTTASGTISGGHYT